MLKIFRNYIWFVCIICFCALICSGCTFEKKDKVCFDSHCFEVEIVQEPEEVMRGLMFRESMDLNKGMFFIFPKLSRYSFWMKNTLIPLDMIWLDQNGQINHIETNVPPCTTSPCPHYTPKHLALYVLELNAGQAAKANLKLGDQSRYVLHKKTIEF